MEKELFCSLPCSTAGRVAIGQPSYIVNMPHLTVIIRHNSRLYRVPVFIAIIAFSRWIVNVCHETHVDLVPPYHSWSLVECHHVSVRVLGLRSLGVPFLSLSHNRKFFSGPSRQTGQGRKTSCPRTVYGQILLSPWSH